MMKELLGFLAGLEDKASWAGHLGIGFTQGPSGGGGELGTCILHSYLCKSLSKHMGLTVTLITVGSGCSICLENPSPESQNSN